MTTATSRPRSGQHHGDVRSPIRPRQSRRSLSAVATHRRRRAGAGRAAAQAPRPHRLGRFRLGARSRPSSRAWTTRSSSRWRRASRTSPRAPTAPASRSRPPQSITDTTGQADKLTAMAGQDYGCYIVNPISGTNLVQGIAQIAAKKNADRQHRQPGRRRRGGGGRRHARPPTSAPTTSQAGAEGRRADGQDAAAAAARSPLIGGISGDVTSGARIDGFNQGLGRQAHGRPDRRGRTGTARTR